MIKRIPIELYINEHINVPIIDVRSPGEFKQGHIPSAFNIPLFSNDERAKVGTVYKQKSKEAAIELGYTFVNPKLNLFIEESQKIAPQKTVAVHCWRGGMRSEAFANHLHENGFEKVYVIEKGYKAFRNYVLSFFETKFNLKILGGYTGSGKTDVLKVLIDKGEQVIDLEGLANHKGSAFGAIGEKEQPTTEHFENNLFFNMQALDTKKTIWLEDESLNIGKVIIPKALFLQMRNHMVYFIDIPVVERAKYLVQTYGLFEKSKLEESILRITKRLGHEKAQMAINALNSGDLQTVAEITLKYYDKAYLGGLEKRDQSTVTKIPLKTVDEEISANALLQF
ncbi:MAG: tRNA 2-selenouridine(34) synthase MnmH [Bacteroidetes bacterium]|nr:MAG: tRNA 2-selenouridine(34) synthase MnmH [Bacteroidota bacterium]